MTEPIEDYWGPDFSENPNDSAPVALLKQQAKLLTHKTQGRVEGDVRHSVDGAGLEWHSLYAVVPDLKGYSFKILTFQHSITRSFPIVVHDELRADGGQIDDMDGFRDWLHATLSSKEVREAITNLLRYGNRVAS